MNPKAELAGRIMMLVCDEIKPDTQRVLDILRDYQIEYSLALEEAAFTRQVNHFLGAKRAEGLSNRSLENDLLYLTMLGNYLDKRPIQITSNDIRDFIMYLSETRKLKTSSIQSILGILRSFFGWLHTEEMIPKNSIPLAKFF